MSVKIIHVYKQECAYPTWTSLHLLMIYNLCDARIPGISSHHIYGWMQDCSNSSVLTMEVLHTWTKPSYGPSLCSILTHWRRVMHICINKLTIIGSDHGLSTGRHQAIIWNNVGLLLIGPLGTNFNEILIKIYTFSFRKIHLKMSSGKWRPFCLGLNVLRDKDHMERVSLMLFLGHSWHEIQSSATITRATITRMPV